MLKLPVKKLIRHDGDSGLTAYTCNLVDFVAVRLIMMVLCPRSKVVTAIVVLLTVSLFRCTYLGFRCTDPLSVRMSVQSYELCTSYEYY